MNLALDEPDGKRPKGQDDLRTLHQQLHAGVLLLQEVLDVTDPGWWKPRRGKAVQGGSAVRLAYGQLYTAWTNIGHWLIREEGAESWTIAPLVTRNLSSAAEQFSAIEFAPEGHLVLTEGVDSQGFDAGDATPVRRVVEPEEPRYTLAEAQQILDDRRKTMELSKGQHVEMRSDEGGTFTGTVQQVDEHVAIIRPDDKALRKWYPKGYDIGRAHWGTRVVPTED